jgi:hypothetical protein
MQVVGPREADLNRTMTITLGDKPYAKDYRIAVRPGGAVTISTLRPVLWRDDKEPCIPVIVTVGATGASNLKIVTKGLATTDGPLAITRFALVRITDESSDPGTTCPKTTVAAGSSFLAGPGTYQFYLKPTNEMPASGSYSGDVAVVSARTEATQFQNLVITVSSRCIRLWGWALLLTGVILGLILTQFLRQRATHLSALRPAGIVVARVHRTQVYLKLLNAASGSDQSPWPQLDLALQEPLEELNDAKLSAFGVTRSWWRLLANPVVKGPELSTHITQTSVRAGLLDMLARDGMGKAAGDADTLSELDALSGDKAIATEADMWARIDAIFSASSAVDFIPPPLAPWTADRIDLELAQLNLGLLMFTAMVTVVAGGIVLIETVPAFGTPRDLLLCLLWGLGFTGGAAALPNLTVETIRTQIGLPRPA